MKPEQIADGIYRLPLGRANAYLIAREAGITLIDAGLPTHGAAILAALEALGRPPEALRAVLLTHRHLDHAGSAAHLAATTGAPVVAHHLEAPAIAGRDRLSPTRWWFTRPLELLVAVSDHRIFDYRPCQVTAAADGWERDGLRLLHLPGHTPGHSGFLLEQQGVVFAGDVAVSTGKSLEQPSRLFTLDPEGLQRSLRRLSRLGPELCCFGHGPPVRQPASQLRELADSLD